MSVTTLVSFPLASWRTFWMRWMWPGALLDELLISPHEGEASAGVQTEIAELRAPAEWRDPIDVTMLAGDIAANADEEALQAFVSEWRGGTHVLAAKLAQEIRFRCGSIHKHVAAVQCIACARAIADAAQRL